VPAAGHSLRTAPPLEIDLGRGVFESVLVVDGSPVALERHLRRLGWSTSALFGAPLPPAVAERARASAAGRSRARLRIAAVPGPAGIDIELDVEDVPSRRASVVSLEPVLLPGGLGPHKWRDRTGAERLEREVSPALPVFVDVDGDVLEATRANVFAVDRGVVVTPPADGRLLPGVTRERVLEAAARLGLDVREDRISLEDLAAADEIFLTSAVRGVAGVGASGEVAVRIAEALR